MPRLFEITTVLPVLWIAICGPILSAQSSPSSPQPEQPGAKAKRQELKTRQIKAGIILILDDLTADQRSQIKSLKKQLHRRVAQLRIRGDASQQSGNQSSNIEPTRNEKFGSAILGGLIATDTSEPEDGAENKGKTKPASLTQQEKNKKADREIKRLKREYADQMLQILTPAQRKRLGNSFSPEQVE